MENNKHALHPNHSSRNASSPCISNPKIEKLDELYERMCHNVNSNGRSFGIPELGMLSLLADLNLDQHNQSLRSKQNR